MNMMNRLLTTTFLASVLFLAASCGDDDDGGSGSCPHGDLKGLYNTFANIDEATDCDGKEAAATAFNEELAKSDEVAIASCSESQQTDIASWTAEVASFVSSGCELKP